MPEIDLWLPHVYAAVGALHLPRFSSSLRPCKNAGSLYHQFFRRFPHVPLQNASEQTGAVRSQTERELSH